LNLTREVKLEEHVYSTSETLQVKKQKSKKEEDNSTFRKLYQIPRIAGDFCFLVRCCLLPLGMDPIFIKIADVRGGVHFINIKHIYEVEEIVTAKGKERNTHIRYYSIPDCKGQVNKVITKEYPATVLERIEKLKQPSQE